MATRQITPPTDAEVARLVVLGALARGMTFAYAARTAAVTLPGWPDIPAVQAVYEALRGAKRKSGPKGRSRPAAPVVPPVPPPPPPAMRARPAGPRPDLSVARVRTEGLRIEQRAEVRLTDGELVARVTETYDCVTGDCGCSPAAMRSCLGRQDDRPDNWPIGEAWPDAPDPTGQLVDVEPLDDQPEPTGLRGLLQHFGVDVAGKTITVAGKPTDDGPPLPPATDSPEPDRPKPRQLPCEVCGIGVLTSYVETTGRQRHGHHPEGS